MPSRSDEQLVREFQRGDEQAFSDFVRRHEDRVYRLAVMWLRDGSLANDVLQEVWVRSYTGLHRFRFGAQPSTWIARICRNVCHEQNRRTVRATALPDRLRGAQRGVGDVVEMEVSPSFDELHDAVRDLPQRQREVVVLRVFEELSVADTAAVMGCRAGTVKASLKKGLANLKTKLENQAWIDDLTL